MESILKAIELEKKIHPYATDQDINKLIYQACFGVGHMISSSDESLQWLKAEIEIDKSEPSLQDIGNGYVRVSCSYMKEDAELFHQLFLETSKANKDENLYQQVIHQLRFNQIEDCHHSHIYRDSYDPHYRILKKEFLDYLEGLKYIKQIITQNKSCLICVDGPCASGKSTFSKFASSIFNLSCIHLDDYFLQPFQKTSQRLNEIGGNVDYERFKKEVLEPWSKKENIYTSRYDCSSQNLLNPVCIPYSNYILVEGSYSHHPYFKGYETKKIFIDISSNLQIERLKHRSALMLQRFIDEWIPKENAYFNTYKIKENSEFVLYPQIRKMIVQDLDQVMKIWLDTNLEIHSYVDQNYWISNFTMVKEALLQAEVYVYECDQIQGFIGTQENYIAGIFVDKKCRTKEIGRQLLERIKSKHTELSLHVYAKNIKAINFYMKHGFIIQEESMDENNEKEYFMVYKKGTL